MKFAYDQLKKGHVFDEAPVRILYGKSETVRRNHYKKQFSLLTKYWNKIPWRQWGVGSAKNLNELLREIGSGETYLTEKDGQLFRNVDIVIVFVFYKKKWLTEEPQQMADGRLRNRRFPYISEKLRLGEDPFDTAVRAIREESGGFINAHKKKLVSGETYLLDQNHPYNTGSSSYPGLKSIKKAYTFAYLISKKEYKTRYVEIDISGSITIHSWKKVSENYWFNNTLLEQKVTKLWKK